MPADILCIEIFTVKKHKFFIVLLFNIFVIGILNLKPILYIIYYIHLYSLFGDEFLINILDMDTAPMWRRTCRMPMYVFILFYNKEERCVCW